ncbi:MAG: hypothetical protein K8953_04650 [Proteobacteria bacterium]|nr:hypothetical protein [Pseudomonadota bacterium]
MRELEFKLWLDAYRTKAKKPLAQTTKNTYIRDNKRVEEEDKFEGFNGLDKEFEKDGLKSLLERYAYSKADERAGRKNPTNMDIKPRSKSVLNSLSSHRTALNHYHTFCLVMKPIPITTDYRTKTG